MRLTLKVKVITLALKYFAHVAKLLQTFNFSRVDAVKNSAHAFLPHVIRVHRKSTIKGAGYT